MAHNTNYLKVLRIVMLINGLWSLSKDSKYFKMYSYYSLSYRHFFLLNLGSILANILFSYKVRDDLIENLSFSITYTLILVALHFTNSDLVKSLIQEILEKESLITENSNKEVKTIYFSHTKYNTKTNAYLLGSVVILMLGQYISWINLITKGVEHNLLLPVYLPFNILKPFWVGFFYSTFQLFAAGFYFVYTRLLFVSLMIYAVSALKILQHFLGSLKSYSVDFAEKNKIGLDEAYFTILRYCILEHKNVISYVKKLNQATSTFLLINFITTSMELCVVLLRLIVLQEKGEIIVTWILLSMHISHLTILYWNADLIRTESMQLAMSLYLHSNWYIRDKKFKMLVQIMIMRAQKPLSLAIGPFGEMSNLAYISVLKAAFSYLTFFKSVYNLK